MRQVLAAALFALTVVAGFPAAARAQDDAQVWQMTVAQGRVGAKFAWYAEVQPRFSDDAGRLGQLLLRPAVGLQLGARTQALVGYAYVRTEPLGGEATDEHRYWQQLVWPILSTEGGLRITARSRLEQRTIVGNADLGWRFRQQIRAQVPFSGRTGRVSAVAWAEPFVHLNTVSWGPRRGFDRLRTFVGAAFPLGPGVTLEPGYLLQHVERAGANRSDHALSLNLFLRP